MSAISRLRQLCHYEKDVPRCETCTQYKRPGLFLVNSLPRKSPPWCKLSDFGVKPTAVCDHWRNAKGETLA